MASSSDVALSNPAANDTLQYDTVTQKWKNGAYDYASLTNVPTTALRLDMSGSDASAAGNSTKLAAAIANAVAGSQLLLTPDSSGGRTLALASPIVLNGGAPSICGTPPPVWAYDAGYGQTVEIVPATTFTGTALISMTASAKMSGINLERLSLNGLSLNNSSGAAIHGIFISGPLTSVRMEKISIRDFTGDGFHVEPTSVGNTKGFHLTEITSESNNGWGFWIDGLTDTFAYELHSHYNTLGGFRLAGLGDFHLIGSKATWNGGPGYHTDNSSSSSRSWGAEVSLIGIHTDRSTGAGFEHLASNINPICVDGFFGRDQRQTTLPLDATLAAVVIGDGTKRAGPITFTRLTTSAGYDDSGQADSYSSPGVGLSVKSASAVAVGSGILWGTATPYSVSQTKVDTVTLNPSVTLMTGSRLTGAVTGPKMLLQRATSASTIGVQTAGDRSFQIGAGYDFYIGQRLVAYALDSSSNPTGNMIFGTVKSYVSGYVVLSDPVAADRVGAGQYTNWLIVGGAAADIPNAGIIPAQVAIRSTTLVASSNTYSPVCDTTDLVLITAPTAAFTMAAPSGTPADGQLLKIRISATASYAITWASGYTASGTVSLPTATVAHKTIALQLGYDASASKWVALLADNAGY